MACEIEDETNVVSCVLISYKGLIRRGNSRSVAQSRSMKTSSETELNDKDIHHPRHNHFPPTNEFVKLKHVVESQIVIVDK